MRSEQILPIGTLLQGRYKIEKVRGKGGFGITYCAMDLKMHARVAIKACVREQEQAARRVQNEATMYFMMTGLTPPEASDRWISDTIQPLEIHLGKRQCQAVMKGMALEAKDRYADIHNLRQDLYSEGADRREEADFTLTTTTGTDTLIEQYKEQVGESKKKRNGRKKKKHRALWITGSCLVIIVSFVLILAGLESMGSDSGSSGVVSSSDLMQAKEQSRIATAIQENKLDNVLNEIDELYPPDSDLSDADKQNRFVLLLNYYMKKGDLVKEKDLLDSVVTTGESAKYDRVFQDLIKEEQKKLATATAAPTARTKK